jgi:hypothetical protein
MVRCLASHVLGAWVDYVHVWVYVSEGAPGFEPETGDSHVVIVLVATVRNVRCGSSRRKGDMKDRRKSRTTGRGKERGQARNEDNHE